MPNHLSGRRVGPQQDRRTRFSHHQPGTALTARPRKTAAARSAQSMFCVPSPAVAADSLAANRCLARLASARRVVDSGEGWLRLADEVLASNVCGSVLGLFRIEDTCT